MYFEGYIKCINVGLDNCWLIYHIFTNVNSFLSKTFFMVHVNTQSTITVNQKSTALQLNKYQLLWHKHVRVF